MENIGWNSWQILDPDFDDDDTVLDIVLKHGVVQSLVLYGEYRPPGWRIAPEAVDRRYVPHWKRDEERAAKVAAVQAELAIERARAKEAKLAAPPAPPALDYEYSEDMDDLMKIILRLVRDREPWTPLQLQRTIRWPSRQMVDECLSVLVSTGQVKSVQLKPNDTGRPR
jgi:hypothetical protein